MTHVASRTRPSLFLRVTLKGGSGLGTRLGLTIEAELPSILDLGPYNLQFFVHWEELGENPIILLIVHKKAP